MKRLPHIIFCVLLLLLANSCKWDSLDFSLLSKEVNLNPEIVAPIAKANLSVWDIIKSSNQGNDSAITKDPSGLIKIIYTQNGLYKYDVRDFLDISNYESFPSENNPLGEISIKDASTSTDVSLDDLVSKTNGVLATFAQLDGKNLPCPALAFPGPAVSFNLPVINEFTQLTLSKGSIDIILDNKLKIPVTISGSFYDLVSNRKIIDFNFVGVAPASISTETDSLENIQISNQVEFRLESFSTTGSETPININLNDYFTVKLVYKNLSISSGNLKTDAKTLEGYKGAYEFPIQNHPEMKVFVAELKKGIMNIKANNSSKLTGTIILVLNYIKGKNGLPVTAAIPMSGNPVTIDLSGVQIDFASDPSKPYNMIPYSYSIRVDKTNGYIDFASTDSINMDVSMTNLEYKSMQGDFGNKTIKIARDSFDMNIDLLNKIDGNLELANPKLELIIHNSIGMPASVSLDLTGSNKTGKTEILKRIPSVFDIPIPANIHAGIATKSIVYDSKNSNIVDFVAMPPTGQITYLGQADFIKTVPVTPQNPNFLDFENSVFNIDLNMELPLELQNSKLTFKDTSAISGNDYDKLESAELIVNATNGIPLDIDLQLFFIDTISNKQFGTSKLTRIITAALVNALGEITPVQSSKTFSLDKSELDDLRKANGIIFSGTLSSPPEGTVAPIRSDSRINLNVVIKAKAKL